MAVIPSSLGAATPLTTQLDANSNSAIDSLPQPKSQPLWPFALVGVGPLSVLAVFALVHALLQRIAGS